MRKYLKQPLPTAPRDLSRVEETARRMIAEIARDRDDAVRRYAVELDKWQGGDFRVSNDEIRTVAASLPETFKDDFAFCRQQVTDFARRQRDSLQEFEVELQPGTVLGQKLIPVATVGCYVPGGKYPLVSAAIMRWPRWPMAASACGAPTSSPARATPSSPRPSASFSASSGSTSWPGRPRSASSPTTAPTRLWWRPTCSG